MSLEKSQYVSIVIDKAQAVMLNGMFHAATESEDFVHWLDAHGHREAFVAFTENVHKVRHEHGWCEDDDCEHND